MVHQSTTPIARKYILYTYSVLPRSPERFRSTLQSHRAGAQNQRETGWETSVLLSMNYFYELPSIHLRISKDPTPSTLAMTTLKIPVQRRAPSTAVHPTLIR